MSKRLYKNIFIKSMLRQPVRSALLIILIATVSFAFVLRTVEYTIVSNQISQISGFFQSVGILSHRDGITADVSPAIDIIAQSPYVAFYDRRRGFEGTLDNMYNAYIEGSRYWFASFAYRYFQQDFEMRELINLMPRLRTPPDFAGFVSGDSFFYGELIYIEYMGWPSWGRGWGFYPHKLLHIQVDDVLQGYPDRVAPGRIIRLRMDFPNFPEQQYSPLTGMEIGQRYFVKGTFYYFLDNMQRDSRHVMMFIRQFGDQQLWYVPVALGETVDTISLGLCKQLQFAQHVQSAVYLRTTKDMTSLPYSQEGLGMLSLRSGRLLNMDDYINANPVIVIPRRFAEIREVSVGDTITININANQHLVYSPYYLLSNYGDMDPMPVPITAFPELGVLSKPGTYPVITLELEIVGIYDMFRWRPIGTNWSSLSKFMFIPDSLIPNYWGLQSAHFGDISPYYSPALWFSFVLHQPRYQGAFLWDSRDALADLGFRVNFVGRDGSSFLNAADTILLSTTLNLVIFSLVLALVLAFTVALFMWQRNREYAILRALGCPSAKIFIQSVIALLFFSIPAVIVGGVAGWFYAIRLAQDTIAGFGEIMADVLGRHLMTAQREELIGSYMEMAVPSISRLVMFCMIIVVSMLVLITIINLRTARQSVLEILKGA